MTLHKRIWKMNWKQKKIALRVKSLISSVFLNELIIFKIFKKPTKDPIKILHNLKIFPGYY